MGGLREWFFYNNRGLIHDLLWYVIQYRRRWQWERSERRLPAPYIVKHEIIKDYAKRFSCSTLVETGTYLGDTVNALKGQFKKIISVELDSFLCQRAKTKFSRFNHIKIICGNGPEVLKDICSGIEEPCLFWLDSTFSGGITARGELITPVVSEIEEIFQKLSDKIIVLINARNILPHPEGKKIMLDIKNIVLAKHPGWKIKERDDVIRITP